MESTLPDFGEPWEYTTFRNCIRDRHGVLRNIEDDLRDRSRVCVNACQGLADPAAEIQSMREAIKEAYARLQDLNDAPWLNLPGRAGDEIESILAKLQPFLK